MGFYFHLVWGSGGTYNLFPKLISALYVESVRNERIEEDVNITSLVFCNDFLFVYETQNDICSLCIYIYIYIYIHFLLFDPNVTSSSLNISYI